MSVPLSVLDLAPVSSGTPAAESVRRTDPAPAIKTYRANSEPGGDFAAPHALLGLAAVCAEADEAAQQLAGTMELAWLRIEQGEFLPLPSPEEVDAYPFTPRERASIDRRRRLTVVGSSHEARLRSYELLAEAFAE